MTVPPRVAGDSQPRLLSPRGYQEGHFYSYKSTGLDDLYVSL